MTEHGHVPVLLEEVIQTLEPRPGEVVVDCTLGRGGHAHALGQRVGDEGLVIGIDRDADNLAYAEDRLNQAGIPSVMIHDSFVAITRHIESVGRPADVVLADLGVSSNQLDDACRGFGFQEDAPLDMRMDRAGHEDVASLLARIDEGELADLIRTYGEDPYAAAIARKVALERQTRPITTTGQLSRLVREAYGPRARSSRLHPATRTFMALRIAVNEEISALETLLDLMSRGCEMAGSGGWLNPGARIGIIAFHSLEDRPVKQAFADLDRRGLASRIVRGTVRPTEAETQANPRSRSAKFRAIRVNSQDGTRET
ncbi:MAG: 16S rRNA (cytosine(1402)-N(4))-methyltransferase RsmH [Planctomycetota bacterium]|nr:16S rRNA (cytosine(1402)-N(4))-methyltransferase RsmH [Planctomycetota bacterium]